MRDDRLPPFAGPLQALSAESSRRAATDAVVPRDFN
jgi:hypothetical protein